MSDIENFKKFYDPFAETTSGNSDALGNIVHIRLQQRNGRKTLTTVQGLSSYLDEEKISRLIKIFKRDFCCNGTVVTHAEWGKVIQLQGDHRTKISEILSKENLVPKDLIKVHGF
ncbi:hypothetical protein H696_02621 [Fonticula alba]|uniref:SUI1 domain-containing protein n=1 Tax=Fonticula alba TaxID=691883 RepID=A0A058Z844_FONAL|nr:hypothetical protein H696_02621 [Fonticula alba]KCV70291.1 hypothetical protein H696_02621 [Fonticula alba]|eukprot:XP_009494807.1 hypothetical protein H696_02621 [Fonticula alba]